MQLVQLTFDKQFWHGELQIVHIPALSKYELSH